MSESRKSGAIVACLVAVLAGSGGPAEAGRWMKGRGHVGGGSVRGSSTLHAGHHGHHHGHFSIHYGHFYGYPYDFHYGWPYYYGYWYPAPYYLYRPAEIVSGPAPAAVETDVTPRKALVSLDGAPVGEARDFRSYYDPLILAPGTHTLEFSHPGYQTLRLELDLKPGGFVHVVQELARGEGIDPRSGEVKPPAPEADEEGETTARAAPTGAGAVGSDIPAPRDSGSLRTGRLFLHVSPPDAAVYLDDAFLASAGEVSRLHGALPVAAGEHTLEVLCPGYQSATRRLLVEEGKSVEVRIDLERAE